MLYFKYMPYLFLVVALFFAYDAYSRYTEGRDPFPSILFVVGAVVMFFIRKKSYKRFDKPNQ